ncbi:hypothetical protein Gotri_013975 [Gossypium trilobum]|uniref:Uncharacterized protein n=1 Tax=Gossypium trilobum TaxID=34281 RepID=A0A7J9DV67_9ROSI|nr:hypothetical protein [Gossypium trilobum]
MALVLSIQFVVGQEEKAFDEAASLEADRVLLSSMVFFFCVLIGFGALNPIRNRARGEGF